MSYLLVVVIGTIAGWIGGQYIKGNEEGIGIDLICGAVGAVVAVVLSRMLGPDATAGYLVSIVISILGAIASIFAVRHFMKAKLVPATRPRSRR